MDLSSIEIFLAVASDRSVTKAAKAVGRVPSNVTTRVQQLEEDLGVALFSRDGKKMTLTREGETFLAYGNRLMALALEGTAGCATCRAIRDAARRHHGKHGSQSAAGPP